MPILPTLVRATQDLTLTANPLNNETVTVAGKVYTFQTTLTDVDGNVDIGGTAEASLDQLINAINLGPGAGTQYAASMTKNPHCIATKISSTVMRVHAQVPGAIGNFLSVAEAIVTGGSWGAATLAGGSGRFSQAITDLRKYGQLNSDVLAALDLLDESGVAEV